MSTRGKWQGMLNIVRFNWPLYVAGMLAVLLSGAGFLLLPTPGLKVVCGITCVGAMYFLFGSLIISHFIYDRSDLYRWEWVKRATESMQIREAIVCHAGFDEASPGLRQCFRNVNWQVLDHFDPDRMTEPSIRRARALSPAVSGTLVSRYDAWPLAAASLDIVFGLLAIHELRSEGERGAWFSEARRCLRESGRVVLAEHVRDAANFVAFGPGFLHFHSRASWRRSWESAGFHCREEFTVTPFVRIFVLTLS